MGSFLEMFGQPSILKLVEKELQEAHLEKIRAETVADHAKSIVAYNEERIARLNKRIEQYKTGGI
jgi:hypothetical protein